jgi:hypothetical protein
MDDLRWPVSLAGDFADLAKLGGLLRCDTCKGVLPLGDVRRRVAEGWPLCCGFTMIWWTQSEVDAGLDRQ